MEKWQKNEILEVLEEKAKELKVIKFYDVAIELGYMHLETEDVKIIAKRFLKNNPTYRVVKDHNQLPSTEPLFKTLVFNIL